MRAPGRCILAADALVLEEVHAFYGDSHVLQGISFALGEGRLLGLLGRNGAGKTTTLATIVGLVRPRGGRIAAFGRTIGGLAPEAVAVRGIALVPQGRRIFRSLSVRENLIVAARRGADGHAAWTLPRVFATFPRLAERQSHQAGVLSGGEQQMLAIGRALMTNPRLLLMDEPSEGLAPQIVAEVLAIVRRLKQEGLSIVLVEQNARFVLDLADDVVILNTGSVALAESAAAVRSGAVDLQSYLGVF